MLQKLSSKIFLNLSRASTLSFSSNATSTSIRLISTTKYKTDCEGLEIQARDQVLWIKFNRPNKYNAITKEMYLTITDSFSLANQDESVKAVVLTGNGEYYSSGNDLSNLTSSIQDEAGPQAGLTKSRNLLQGFVDSFINLEKFLIGAINGPAIGIPVTTLPLFDHVIASDKAIFTSPFTSLGQCPEACSSYTFPRLMGPSRASEILMLNMTWDAHKAEKYGLVSTVVEHDQFHQQLESLLYGKRGIVNSCYPNSLKVCKALVRSPQMKQHLMETNKRECDAILSCWLGQESQDALDKFFRKSKK